MFSVEALHLLGLRQAACARGLLLLLFSMGTCTTLFPGCYF
jgi:hypothetical protein